MEMNLLCAGAGIGGLAVILWLFVGLAPWVQGNITFPQLVVGILHKRAQRASYLAHGADAGLLAYKTMKAEDRSCPKSLWMEVCGK